MSIPGAASPLFIGAAAADAAAYQIDRSLRFDLAASSKLTRTPSSASNRRTWTMSYWIKRSKLNEEQMVFSAAESSSNRVHFYFPNENQIAVYSPSFYYTTNHLARDPSAWMHLVFACDTTQATNTNRFKIYKNGVLIDSFQNQSHPAQNLDTTVNGAYLHQFSGRGYNTDDHFDGYLAEVQFIDGQQLAATDFGEEDSNGVWQPKQYAGTYGAKHNGGWVGDTTGTGHSASHLIDKAFDGSASTSAASAAGGALTFTPSTAITGITKVRIHAQRDNSASSATVTLNGTDISSNWNNGDDKTVEITTDNLTSLAWTTQSNGQWFAVRKIEIYYSGAYYTLTPNNSFYLKFADNSSNAALGTDSSGMGNTWTVTNITASEAKWSSYLTSTAAFGSSNGPEKAFDNSLAGADVPFTDSTAAMTWAPLGGYAYTSKVEIYVGGIGGFTYSLNGASAVTATINAWNTVATGSGTINTLVFDRGNNETHGPHAIRVDNTVLVDGTRNPANTDSLIDTPTNYTADSGNNGGNYCTWNPLSTNSTPTFSDGNLTVTNSGSGSSGWRNIASTMGVSSGKWYMEFQTVGSMNGGLFIGIQKVPEDNDQFNPASFSNNFVGMTANSYSLNAFSGNKRTNGSDSSYGSGQAVNDILMMAVDLDNGKIWWGKNGTWFASGDPDSGTNAAFTGLSGTFVFAVGISANEKIHSNWGQRPFAYSNNISGFNSVCTQNLDESAYASIADGSTAFDAITYVGTDTTRTFTGFNMSPDLAWFKSRSTAYDHILFDSVRGATKRLKANSTAAEDTNSTGLTAFTSDGFTVGGADSVNGPSDKTYVAWAWDAGTSTVSNTDGSITTSVRVNQSAGFSIVKGNFSSVGDGTLGHGLNAAPTFYIIRNIDSSSGWYVYTTAVDGTLDYAFLNGTDAFSASSRTSPTSSVIQYQSIATGDHIAYCWTPVEGYSAFGTYLGNSDANGSFAFCGFAPALVVVKASSSTGNWYAYDRARGPFNPNDNEIYWNLSSREYTINRDIDFLSNGFKIRTNDNGFNASGVTYIWMAWAEHPFRTARAR